MTNPVETYTHLKQVVASAKRSGKAVVSNYFPNPKLHGEWIEKGALRYAETGRTVFFIHDRGTYREVLFFSASFNDLVISLASLKTEIGLPAVVEIISKSEAKGACLPVAARLKRMVRIGNPPEVSTDKNVVNATADDLPTLDSIFTTHFSPALERVPDSHELQSLVAGSNVFVYKTPQGVVAGFCVFERTGSSIHLRYWWVHPDFRNCGIGSALLQSFFHAGKHTMKQLLWVFDDNANAIKRYRHYGFEFDGMVDEICLL